MVSIANRPARQINFMEWLPFLNWHSSSSLQFYGRIAYHVNAPVTGVSMKDNSPNLVDQAYETLKAAILAGQLPPGTALSRRSIAEELSMSALPVSSAFSRLASEGLVEVLPRSGTRVKLPTSGDISGNYVVREALETHSARLFAELASSSARARLRQLAAALDTQYQALGRTRNPEAQLHARVERAHLEFHMTIVAATRCPELAQAIERSRVLLFNWLFATTGDYVPLPKQWHSQLAEPLIEGTMAQAAEAMRTHVRYRMDSVLAKFANLGALEPGRRRGKLTELRDCPADRRK